MDINKLYNQLTNVDIEQQKLLWDERGKGYYGEYLVFCELYKTIPGTCKILMNLNIPVSSTKTTEIDLILIHETGLYIFEVKHYKGTIYGKSSDNIWTQYFRTAKNNTFKNPMLQNEYHIKAIKELLPNIPVKSIIIFTNDECEIKVTNTNTDIELCTLYDIHQTLNRNFNFSNTTISTGKIDEIFCQLSPYSKIKEPVEINGVEQPFSSWVDPFISELKKNISEVEQEKAEWLIKANRDLENQKASIQNERNLLEKAQQRAKKTKKNCIILSIVFSLVCFLFYSSSISNNKKEYDNKLAEFKQNFLHVDEIGNEYIDELNSYVEITNVNLTTLSDDAVSFTARISMNNDVYGIEITESAKYIVMTQNGQVFEYDVFGEHLTYNRFSNLIGKNIRAYGDLANAQFFGISNINDITYIKMTNINLIKTDLNRTIVKDGLEIELYSK